MLAVDEKYRRKKIGKMWLKSINIMKIIPGLFCLGSSLVLRSIRAMAMLQADEVSEDISSK